MIDRFACRREGHIGSRTPDVEVFSAYEKCQRCGEWFQTVAPTEPAGVRVVPGDDATSPDGTSTPAGTHPIGPGRNTAKVSRGQGQKGA